MRKACPVFDFDQIADIPIANGRPLFAAGRAATPIDVLWREFTVSIPPFPFKSAPGLKLFGSLSPECTAVLLLNRLPALVYHISSDWELSLCQRSFFSS
jgi:hypothetical protein